MKNILKQKRESAALIIALLIVAVAGMVVVAAGRDIVQNNLSTARYTDALNANTLAWAGIEDGLMRVRTADTLNSNINNFFNPYWPIFNWPGLYSENVGSDTYVKRLYQRVIRRNVTETVGTGVQRAGVFYNGPHSTVPDLLQGFGINYNTPLNESCRDPITGDPFDSCDASRWSQSDNFYDFRVSGSDDDLGVTYSPPSETAKPNRTVNLDASDNIIMKSGFYNVCRNASDPGKCDPLIQDVGGTTYFVDRIFDLSNYTGNLTSSGAWAGAENQKIALKYQVNGLGGAETISINTGVKYVDPDPTTTVNENLSCYASAPPQGGFLLGDNFFGKVNPISSAQNGVDTVVYVPIPKPCISDFAGNVEYFFMRFRMSGYPNPYSSGCANCNVSFGLRTSAFPGGAPPWWPRNDSFIGTGVYKIKSTGIYNNVKKTVEVWVSKNLYTLAQDPTGQGNYLHCVNIPPPADVNIRNCSIRYYRQINY